MYTTCRLGRMFSSHRASIGIRQSPILMSLDWQFNLMAQYFKGSANVTQQFLTFSIRAHSLYSMVDGSTWGFSAMSEKKLKTQVCVFSCQTRVMLFGSNFTDCMKTILTLSWQVGGKKTIKIMLISRSFFYLWDPQFLVL